MHLTMLKPQQKREEKHVVRNDGCINSITEFEVVGQRGRRRPKKTWKDTINNDLGHWKLSCVQIPQTEWSGERSRATHFKWN